MKQRKHFPSAHGESPLYDSRCLLFILDMCTGFSVMLNSCEFAGWGSFLDQRKKNFSILSSFLLSLVCDKLPLA